MKKLFEKNQLVFALIWIFIYIFIFSIADSISESIGIIKIITVPVLIVLAALILIFITKNKLQDYYGLKNVDGSFKNYLYFIPLIIVSTSNLWSGVTGTNYTALETVLYIVSMLFVGLLEEIIFRGFLFKAIEKRRSLNLAIVISSITFGLGHIINLLSGADFIPTLLQVIYAIAFGYLFTIIFIKSNSLIPGIISHGVINSLSAFGVQPNITVQVIITAVLVIITVTYSLYLNKSIKA